MGQSSMAAAVAADGTLKQSDVVTVDVHSLSDMAFLFRQRIRHLFMILDENSTGTLSRDEIFRLLRHHLKCSITIPESNAVFEYVVLFLSTLFLSIKMYHLIIFFSPQKVH